MEIFLSVCKKLRQSHEIFTSFLIVHLHPSSFFLTTWKILTSVVEQPIPHCKRSEIVALKNDALGNK